MNSNAATLEMLNRQTWIEVKQYPSKQQIKVFIKLHDGSKERAKAMFQRFYKASECPIYDEHGVVKYYRKMRAYLVKDEGTMEKLAKEKFVDDLKKKQMQNTSNLIGGQSSRGGISSIEAHSNSFGSMMSRGVQSGFGLTGAGRGSQGRAPSRGAGSMQQRRNRYPGGTPMNQSSVGGLGTG